MSIIITCNINIDCSSWTKIKIFGVTTYPHGGKLSRRTPNIILSQNWLKTLQKWFWISDQFWYPLIFWSRFWSLREWIIRKFIIIFQISSFRFSIQDCKRIAKGVRDLKNLEKFILTRCTMTPIKVSTLLRGLASNKHVRMPPYGQNIPCENV